MNIEEYRFYCLSKKGATESFPFPGIPNVLVFKVMGKMFSATDISSFHSITLKCNPDIIVQLREKYSAVHFPSYMSKKHWNSILMDNTISDELLRQWIDESYNLVVSNLTRKEKEILSKDMIK